MGDLRIKAASGQELVVNTKQNGRYDTHRAVELADGRTERVHLNQATANVYDRLYTDGVKFELVPGAKDTRDKLSDALDELGAKFDAAVDAGKAKVKAGVAWVGKGQVEAAENSWGGLGKRGDK